MSIPFDPRDHQDPYLLVTVANGCITVLQGPPDSHGYVRMMTATICDETAALACIRGAVLHQLPVPLTKRIRIVRGPGADEDGLLSNITYYIDDAGARGSFQLKGTLLIA